MASESGEPASAPAEAPGGRLVVVATGNRGKLDEIRTSLDFPGWRFVSASELDPTWESPEETGSTFEENARIKAVQAHAHFGAASLADDSGLEVDALDGEPGVFSSRYAGECATDAENNARLLLAMAGLLGKERWARFRCTMVFIDDDGSETVATGTCEGVMGDAPRGEGGFGYDPLFMPDVAGGRTMAELPMAEKNAISHRGSALRALREILAGKG